MTRSIFCTLCVMAVSAAAVGVPHPGILPNYINNPNRGGIGGAPMSTNKAVIDLNHCTNEKRKALLDTESAQNALRFCEKEAASLRDEEEKCRHELHTQTTDIELLRQENEKLRLQLKFIEGKDSRCGEMLEKQHQHAADRLRGMEESAYTADQQKYLATTNTNSNTAADGSAAPSRGSSGAASSAHSESLAPDGLDALLGSPATLNGAALSYRAALREQWESKVQQLEMRLLAADKEARTLEARHRSAQHALEEVSHALEVERLSKSKSKSRSRSRSASLSPSESAAQNAPPEVEAEVEDEGELESDDAIKFRLRREAERLRQQQQLEESGSAAPQNPHPDDAYLVRGSGNGNNNNIINANGETAEERRAALKRDNDLRWKVRQHAAQHREQEAEAAARLERLRRSVEDTVDMTREEAKQLDLEERNAL